MFSRGLLGWDQLGELGVLQSTESCVDIVLRLYI